MDSLKRKPIGDIIDPKDLENVMNMAIVMYGKQIDLLRLRALVDECPELTRVYMMTSWEMFRIVKLKEWEEFDKWKRKTKP